MNVHLYLLLVSASPDWCVWYFYSNDCSATSIHSALDSLCRTPTGRPLTIHLKEGQHYLILRGAQWQKQDDDNSCPSYTISKLRVRSVAGPRVFFEISSNVHVWCPDHWTFGTSWRRTLWHFSPQVSTIGSFLHYDETNATVVKKLESFRYRRSMCRCLAAAVVSTEL